MISNNPLRRTSAAQSPDTSQEPTDKQSPSVAAAAEILPGSAAFMERLDQKISRCVAAGQAGMDPATLKEISRDILQDCKQLSPQIAFQILRSLIARLAPLIEASPENRTQPQVSNAIRRLLNEDIRGALGALEFGAQDVGNYPQECGAAIGALDALLAGGRPELRLIENPRTFKEIPRDVLGSMSNFLAIDQSARAAPSSKGMAQAHNSRKNSLPYEIQEASGKLLALEHGDTQEGLQIVSNIQSILGVELAGGLLNRSLDALRGARREGWSQDSFIKDVTEHIEVLAKRAVVPGNERYQAAVGALRTQFLGCIDPHSGEIGDDGWKSLEPFIDAVAQRDVWSALADVDYAVRYPDAVLPGALRDALAKLRDAALPRLR